MATNLMIIESPNKIATIGKFLDSSWEIIATIGHIRDLAKTGPRHLGFDEKTLEPNWINATSKVFKMPNAKSAAERIKEIQSAAATAKNIYIATDPDREGEAIAWHVYEVIDAKDKKKVNRVTFNEITKTAVSTALEHPRKINNDWVNSQFARRILDRLVGFTLSKLVSSKLHAKSAGRVQTIALKFIYDREMQIRNFKSYNWWTIQTYIQTEDELVLRAINKDIKNVSLFVDKNEEKEENKNNNDENSKAEILFDDEKSAKLIYDSLGKEYEVYAIDKPMFRTHSQPAPLKTSTLQILGINKLGWSISKVSQVAQHLYEGINTKKDGHVAFISYPRTDSIRYSNVFVNEAKKYILNKFGEDYYDDKYAQSVDNTDKKNVQDAHEAIRILDFDLTPEYVKNVVPTDEYKLYKLIWMHTIATLMPPSKSEIIAIRFVNNDNKFYTNYSSLIFDGYKKVYDFSDEEESEKFDVDKFKIGMKFKAKSCEIIKHDAPPPPRFNQASLISALEKDGVGRPSTYKQMVNIAAERGYAEIKNKAFYLADLGEKVINMLEKYFQEIVDINLTKEMEEHLDEISHHDENWKEWVLDFKKKFDKELDVAYDKIPKYTPTLLSEKCPQCGKPLVERFSARTHSKFIGCSGYPECHYIKTATPVIPPIETNETCPICNKNILLIRTSHTGNKFIACKGFPKCHYTRPVNMTHEQYTEIQTLKKKAKENKTKLQLPPELEKLYLESRPPKKKVDKKKREE